MVSYRKAQAAVGLLGGASEDGRVRWIELDGAVNVRDLGGLDTDDGRTTLAGRLLRGDNLQGLSPADVKLLVDDIGVTTIVDLRAPAEVESEGPGPLTRVGSVRHAHHSVLPEVGSATDVAADALAVRRHDGALIRYPDDLRCGYYLGYLEDRPDQVAGALRSIVQGPGAGELRRRQGPDRRGGGAGTHRRRGRQGGRGRRLRGQRRAHRGDPGPPARVTHVRGGHQQQARRRGRRRAAGGDHGRLP